MLYQERLWVPPAYWLIGLFFGLTTVIGVTFSLGDAILWASVALTGVILAWALLSWGSASVTVTDRGLRADGAFLEYEFMGPVTVLDEAATRIRLGRDADRRAFLVARPYLRRAVVVAVADPADPHPFWLITSRRPVELAESLAGAARASGRSIDVTLPR